METKTSLILVILTFVLFGCKPNTPSRLTEEGESDTISIKVDTCTTPLKKVAQNRRDTLLALATAFAIQESELKEDSVSPCGNYVGCLQISVIMVAEANRLLGYVQYVTTADRDDRLNKYNSLEIFRIVQSHHNPDLDVDKAIDIWNKNAPRQYRENVKYYYEQLLNDRELHIFF